MRRDWKTAANHRGDRRFGVPKRDPNTPRMISRPTWLPMARAALLPKASSSSLASVCLEHLVCRFAIHRFLVMAVNHRLLDHAFTLIRTERRQLTLGRIDPCAVHHGRLALFIEKRNECFADT